MRIADLKAGLLVAKPVSHSLQRLPIRD